MIAARILLMQVLVGLLSACSTTTPSPPSPQPRVESTVLAIDKQPQDVRLNVALELFAAGLSADARPDEALSQVRFAETHYLPYALKSTLDSSRAWGAVRVLPESDPAAEVQISGTILESNGVELKIHLMVTDAAGRVWINAVYSDLAESGDYTQSVGLMDPFQDGFNRMANDLLKARDRLTPAEREQLLDISMLNYGLALAPQAFSDYLEVGADGLVSIARLPHRQDPMYERVRQIRAREFNFADAVDGHYQALYHRIGETYFFWRQYSYELIMGNRRLEALKSGKPGSWQAMAAVYKTYRNWKMNEDEVREMASSFDSEISPTVMRVENQIVNLSGSLHLQYAQWRRILAEIYREETGFER